MNDLNSILIEGNLTRDPVLNVTPTGVRVCNFSLGTHFQYKKDGDQRKETSFFDAEYLCRGRGVRVVGRLKQDRWKDGEGKPRSRVKIVAEHVEFKPARRSGNDESEDKPARTAERMRERDQAEELAMI